METFSLIIITQHCLNLTCLWLTEINRSLWISLRRWVTDENPIYCIFSAVISWWQTLKWRRNKSKIKPEAYRFCVFKAAVNFQNWSWLPRIIFKSFIEFPYFTSNRCFCLLVIQLCVSWMLKWYARKWNPWCFE